MAIVIDGYNFLDGAGILDLAPGHYSLQKSREAILRVLRAKLSAAECGTTTVVFDGTEAPPGLKRSDRQYGITILYSARGELADDLIERLIGQHSHPRQLTVVSSDHRIQRAARRRQAKPVDSDVWYRGLLSRNEGGRKKEGGSADTQPDVQPGDVAGWMKEFGDIDLEELEAEADRENRHLSGDRSLASEKSTSKPSDPIPKSSPPRKPKDPLEDSPFPSGYGEDVLEESDKPDSDFNPFPKGYGEDLLE